MKKLYAQGPKQSDSDDDLGLCKLLRRFFQYLR